MVVVFIHLVFKVHLPESTELFICTPTCVWYQARTQRGCGGCVRIPLLGHIISKSSVFGLHPHFRPQNGHFLKDSHPLFKRLRVSLGIVTEYLFYLDQGGEGGCYSDFLTFACFRGSAPALTARPRKYQNNLALSQNTRSFHRTQKYQDYNVTKNANNAEHTEIPLNC